MIKIIRITYPSLLHGRDFLCFLVMNYSWIWEVCLKNSSRLNQKENNNCMDVLSTQEYLKKKASEAFSPSSSLIHTWRTFCSSACNEFITELIEGLHFSTGTTKGLESLLLGCALNNTDQTWEIKNSLSLVVNLRSYANCSKKGLKIII